MGDERSSPELRVTRDDRPAPARSRGRAPSNRGSSAPTRPRRRRRSWLFRTIYWMCVLGIWAVIGLGGLIAYYGARLPPIQNLEVPARPPNIAIMSADGVRIADRGEMGGAAVALKDLPPYVGKAFVAIEDRRFYSHFGIDVVGFARAMLNNLVSGQMEQGGSSLTQQLAKNLFLTQERTIERKVQEGILALWLERKYSKDQILEMYINRVYFGAGAHGIEAASRRYFRRPAKQLTLPQAAMLAGLMKAPSRLAPNRNLAGAQQRAALVIQAMLDTDAIDNAEAKAALTHPATVFVNPINSSGNYPADWITGLLEDYVGQVEGDLVVETTINSKLQAAAEKIVSQELVKNGVRLRVSQGALVAMDPDGAVRALVGGRSYNDSQFNRVIQARRQPGSTFKPFVYLAALEHGATPDTVRDDAPINLGGWKPADFSKEYRGPVKLGTALALSLNTVAVRLCAEVGPKSVIDVAQRLGIVSPLQANPSIALGTSEVSPLEITAAYAAFANGGRPVIPYVVTRVKSVKGKVLYQRKVTPMPVVVASDKLGMMNSMMRETLTVGTARNAALPGWQSAGKSGTSQNYRDAWFIGFTSKLVTGVWVGNDDGSSTKRVTGGSLPATIWRNFMRTALKGVSPQPLPGRPWLPPPEPEVDPVLAQQPQLDGAPDDQPVATRPADDGQTAPGPSVDDWIKQVLSQ